MANFTSPTGWNPGEAARELLGRLIAWELAGQTEEPQPQT